MNGSWISPFTVAAALGCGLVGGIFFAFSNFVMRGLDRLPPEQGAAAMRHINVTVLNPLFLLLFVGTAVGCLVLGGAACLYFGDVGARYLLAGGALYFVGTFLVTMVCNVPLNNALEADAGIWPRYMEEWTRWNHVRTLAAVLASGAFVLALRNLA